MTVIWPWVVTKGWLHNRNLLETDVWLQVAPDYHVLEKRITPAQFASLDPEVQDKYAAVYRGEDVAISDAVNMPSYHDAPIAPDNPPHSYWLRIAAVPESERVRWPTYVEELNLKETEAVMEGIELYRWLPQKFRFILRDIAWRAEI